MRVLVGINHPAHVHFFRHIVARLNGDGHEVLVAARNKECEFQLLDAFGIPYEDLGAHRKGLAAKALAMLATDARLWRIARRFRPDVLTGIHNTYVAHASLLLRRPHVLFTDTEHARLANALTLPFAAAIYTPETFARDLGPSHRRYAGFHELAYLDPRHFVPADRASLGLGFDGPYALLRCVSWRAAHDVGHGGFADVAGAVRELERFGRVLVSGEGALPPGLERYRIRLAPERMHDVLYHASLYIGEGGTMATEAALLGTPSIFLSSLAHSCGVFEEEARADLLVLSTRQADALARARTLLEDPEGSKRLWKGRRDALLATKVDVVDMAVRALEMHARTG